jgi:polysaccharide pyruvyl transferase WcaK-like protein
MTRHRITLFGNFGTQNLGNECTLQAITHNVHKYVPHAELHCICTDPHDTSRRHQISTSAMSSPHRSRAGARGTREPALVRALRKVVMGAPRELMHWIDAFKTLKGTDMLVMAGTGILDDFGVSRFGLHYEIFKWSLLAKLRGCRLMFVSVGAGGLRYRLSRWFLRAALSLADYRSYRDTYSKDLLTGIGVDTRRDPVYPDLAFSLPAAEAAPARAGDGRGAVVGLGLMEYYGRPCNPEDGRAVYAAYIDNVATFVTWLLEHGYTVRLLLGDMSYDSRAAHDVIGRLHERQVSYEPGRLIHEPVSSVADLLAQLAQTQLVVASRFHNVLLALKLSKPVLSISYYGGKNESLMAGVGLAQYCQQIERVDVTHLTEQLVDLQAQAVSVQRRLTARLEEYRAALDEQYRLIFAAAAVSA